MKVTLIYGRAGSGKSTLIHNLCNEKRINKSKIVVIVPDQYTHQTELDIIAAYASKGLIGTDVLSFKRLSHRLKLLYGGASIITLNEDGRSMLINGILNKNLNNENGNSNIFSNGFTKTNVSTDVAKLISRFKQYGITSEALEQCNIDSEKYAHTIEKLKEVAKIYKEYEMLSEKNIENGFIDQEDDVKLLCDNIAQSLLFKDTDIFIDGFDDFAKNEFGIVEMLIRHSKSVTVSLPVDYICDDKRKLMVKRQNNMAKNVESIVADCGIVPSRIWLTNNVNMSVPDVDIISAAKKRSSGISFIEKNIFRSGFVGDIQTDGVCIVNEANNISECEHAADEIVRLVRDNGYRYNEIAVLCGNIDLYEKYISLAFSRRDIPYFMDIKRNISNHPIVRFILGLLNILLQNKSTVSMISWLKTGVLIASDADEKLFSYDDIAYIEKYCTQYYISSGSWEKDFLYGNKYFDIERLNKIREKIIYYIKPFENAMKSVITAGDIANVVENYLSDLGIYKIIENEILRLQTSGQADTALEYSNIINVLSDIWAQINTFTGECVMNTEEFTQMLINCFDKVTVNIIPACIDRVSIVDTGRTVAQNIKALFVIGSQCVSVGEESNLFNMTELDMLKAYNIDIGIDSEKAISDEEYYIYKMLSKPTDYLYISSVSQNDSIDNVSNPMLLNAVKKIFGTSLMEIRKRPTPYLLSEIDNIESARNAMLFEKTTSNEKTDDYNRLHTWMLENLCNKYKILSSITEKGMNYELTTERINSDYIVKREKNNYVVDISKLEQYLKCPYAYFVKYCLRPQGENGRKVSHLDIGNIVHSLLELFVRLVLAKDSPSQDDIDKFMSDNFDKLVAEYETGKFSSMNENKYILKRIKNFMYNMFSVMLKRHYFSSTIIFATELMFDDNLANKNALPAIECISNDGTAFKIRGKIDYVEYCVTSEGRYWIVNDYKTGKTPSNADIMRSRSLQLPIYMFALLKNDDQSLPGAMFYINVNDNVIETQQNTIEAIKEKRFGKMGLISENEELYRGIDNTCTKPNKTDCDILSYDIRLSTAISDAKNLNIIDSDKMRDVTDSALKMAGDIFSDIKNGYIVKSPLSKNTCNNCQYRRFCGYDKKLKNTDGRVCSQNNMSSENEEG